MANKLVKWLLIGATASMFVGLSGCNLTGANSTPTPGVGPQFLEGSLEKIKIGETIVLNEYIDYVTDSEYTIVVRGANGFSEDITRKKAWTPDEPGVYTIVYTVLDGEFKGETTFELTVGVPKMSWAYTVNSDFYDMGEQLVFAEFFEKMNIAVSSYYDWKVVMDSVTVDDVTTEFTESDTSYTINSFSEHILKYHVETEDGQEKHAEQRVGVRYVDEETMSFLQANNMVEHNAITIAHGGVTLNDSKYGSGETTGAPRATLPSEQSYMAYEGEYGIGDFVAFDFTGNNMPALGFFIGTINNSMFYSNIKDNPDKLDKGIVMVNGATQNDGNVFAKWSSSVCNRLNIYGPKKIANMDNDTEGWFRRSIKGVDPLSMTYQANNPNTKFRMVAGFIEGTETYATLAFYLCDRDTGEIYYKGSFKVDWATEDLVMPIDENYYKGNIVAYGHYGKKTVFDKVYPVVHADSLQEAIETFFPLSQFQANAPTKVTANAQLSVDDYVVKEAGYQHTLNVIDEAGNVTPVTGDTFALPIGVYTLQYKDGKNDVVSMVVQSSDISAGGQSWLTDNNVTYNRLNSISDDGKIVLGAGKTSGDRPTDTTVNDYAYLAFNNNYSVYRDGGDVGVYIGFEYVGNNMPNVLFFGDEITNNIFVGSEATGNKGIVFSNGCTVADGSRFETWNESVNNRLNIFGPNKIRNMGRTYEGNFRSLVSSTSLGMTYQEEHATTRFRLTLGFVELRETATAQYVKATIYLVNADTGERLYGGTKKLTADLFIPGYTYQEGQTPFTDYFQNGKIAVYGQIGKETTIEKIYAPKQVKGGGGGGTVFGEYSQFVSGCTTSVTAGTALNVSDYIVNQEGVAYTALNVIDASGNVTPVSGTTFTLPSAGEYLLSYCDGVNFKNAIKLTATDATSGS